MRLDDDAAACRRCADLVTVYESARGQLALLLHHTLVPLEAERRQWRTDTRRATRIALRALRDAGFSGRAVVLQWIAVRDAATIMHAWRCQYDADPVRRAQLTAVASRFARDEHFLASRVALPRETPRIRHDPRPPFATSAVSLRALRRWYDTTAPGWLSIETGAALRTRDAIATVARGSRAAARRRRSLVRPERSGGLCGARARARGARPQARDRRWQPWIRRLGASVERALRQPLTTWDCAWARALLLIPVAIPHPVGSATSVPLRGLGER